MDYLVLDNTLITGDYYYSPEDRELYIIDKDLGLVGITTDIGILPGTKGITDIKIKKYPGFNSHKRAMQEKAFIFNYHVRDQDEDVCIKRLYLDIQGTLHVACRHSDIQEIKGKNYKKTIHFDNHDGISSHNMNMNTELFFKAVCNGSINVAKKLKKHSTINFEKDDFFILKHAAYLGKSWVFDLLNKNEKNKIPKDLTNEIRRIMFEFGYPCSL